MFKAKKALAWGVFGLLLVATRGGRPAEAQSPAPTSTPAKTPAHLHYPGGGRYQTTAPFLVVLVAPEGEFFTRESKVYDAEFLPFAGSAAVDFAPIRWSPFDPIKEKPGTFRKLAVQIQAKAKLGKILSAESFFQYSGELRLIYKVNTATANQIEESEPGPIEPMPDPCDPVGPSTTPASTSIVRPSPQSMGYDPLPPVVPKSSYP
jgi:hypothetical protein